MQITHKCENKLAWNLMENGNFLYYFHSSKTKVINIRLEIKVNISCSWSLGQKILPDTPHLNTTCAQFRGQKQGLDFFSNVNSAFAILNLARSILPVFISVPSFCVFVVLSVCI